MSSGSLTEEQKRRIEENKRKALAKRAEKSSQSPVKSVNPQTRPSGSSTSSTQNSNPQAQPSGSGISSNQSSNLQFSYNAKPAHTVPRNIPVPQNIAGRSGNLSKSVVHPPDKTKGNNFSQSSSGACLNKNNTSSLTKSLNAYSCNSAVNKTTSFSKWASNNGNTKLFEQKKNSNTASSSQTRTNQSVSVGKYQKPQNSSLSNVETVANSIAQSSVKPEGAAGKNPFSTFGKNTVKGCCVLISRERFEVNVGYCAPLLEVFKSMKTKLYDAATKKWSFKLEDYENLMNAVKDLRPAVQLEPLPRPILQVFSSQLKGVYPPSALESVGSADLSAVDNILTESLLPFQRVGVNFGIHKNGRVLIADDMGLGKTIQAICLAAYYRDEWPLLVVVPSSVRFDWAQQIRRWLPSVDPQEIQVAVSGKDSCTSSLVNILSYDLMARKAADLKKKHFQVIIMDECHLLKNYKTARCKAAMPLLQTAHRVILLSGTPALSRPSELYTQISAITPFLFKYQDFGIRYCDGKQQPWGWDFSGSSNMEELQILLEEKIMIRRQKKDVLKQLPAKFRQMVLLDPSSIKINKDMKDSSKVMNLKGLKGMERRGALLEYFHKTGKAKISAVRDYVADLMENDRKFLIFAHHQEALDAIEDIVCSKIGKDGYFRIDGKTSPEQRNFHCRKFQTNENVKVAILSITAANAGLNLSAANLVVFGELFWNPGILVQAEDRAHRIGQQDMVNIHYLVAQNTADDHIWPLVQKKLDVLNKAGLSKDNFSEADTTRVKDSKQTELMQYFEESFLEEDDSFLLENSNTDDLQTLEALSPPDNLQQSRTQKKDTSPSKSPRKTPIKKEKQFGDMLKYVTVSPRKELTEAPSTSSATETIETIPDDDLDLLMGDVDWDADDDMMEPVPKKIKR